MFRAPEVLDLFSGFEISEKIDIFSLGCVMFTILFFKSPFNVEMKLDQMNGRYKIPREGVTPAVLKLMQ